MNRREFVVNAGLAMGTTLLGTKVFAANSGHNHHDHGNPKSRPVSKQLKTLQDETFICLKAGELCLAQCNAVLAGGKTSMAECQLSVMNMLAAVEAMSKIAIFNTADEKSMKIMAEVCAEFCRKCEKECKQHADSHAECKACMEACNRCAKACDDFRKA